MHLGSGSGPGPGSGEARAAELEPAAAAAGPSGAAATQVCALFEAGVSVRCLQMGPAGAGAGTGPMHPVPLPSYAVPAELHSLLCRTAERHRRARRSPPRRLHSSMGPQEGLQPGGGSSRSSIRNNNGSNQSSSSRGGRRPCRQQWPQQLWQQPMLRARRQQRLAAQPQRKQRGLGRCLRRRRTWHSRGGCCAHASGQLRAAQHRQDRGIAMYCSQCQKRAQLWQCLLLCMLHSLLAPDKRRVLLVADAFAAGDG